MVEVGSYVAVPSAGLALRQLGARVIRVDPVGGAPDIARWPLGRDGRSLYWAGLNRGKESVVLDLAAQAGQQTLRRLACAGGAAGGILLSNIAGKPWLSDDLLRRHRPDLIYVQVVGRSDGGPAVDYTVNAASGLAHATGPEDADLPLNHALPAWDLLAGGHTALAVLAAVRRREATGDGAFIRVALEDVAASTLTTLGFLPDAHLRLSNRPAHGNYLYGTFGTDMPLADGNRIMLVALTPRQWESLAEVTGSASAAAAAAAALGADFSSDGDRYRHRHVLAALMRPWFEARTLAEVSAELAGSRVLWAPFRHFTDVVSDVRDGAGSPVVLEVTEPGFGPTLATAGPARRSGEDPAPARAPRLGQHTESVLSELAAGGQEQRGPGTGSGGEPDEHADSV